MTDENGNEHVWRRKFLRIAVAGTLAVGSLNSACRTDTGRPPEFTTNRLNESALTPATVDGLRVHWASAGSGEHTIVLVHGWTCDSTSWTYQVPALSNRYRVVTLDLPGHGRSQSPEKGQFAVDLFARAVEAVRAEAKADTIVLVGHSMGAPVIRQYAALYPQHVAGLIAVDGPLVRPNWATYFGGGGLPSPSQFAGTDGLTAREGMIRETFTPQTPAALQQRILDMMLKAPEATAVGAFAWVLDADIWKPDTPQAPALAIFAGTESSQSIRDTRQRMPGLEVQQIAGTGHFVMMEQPEKFNQMVKTFVEHLTFK